MNFNVINSRNKNYTRPIQGSNIHYQIPVEVEKNSISEIVKKESFVIEETVTSVDLIEPEKPTRNFVVRKPKILQLQRPNRIKPRKLLKKTKKVVLETENKNNQEELKDNQESKNEEANREQELIDNQENKNEEVEFNLNNIENELEYNTEE